MSNKAHREVKASKVPKWEPARPFGPNASPKPRYGKSAKRPRGTLPAAVK
jgi:hypothetical protein